MFFAKLDFISKGEHKDHQVNIQTLNQERNKIRIEIFIIVRGIRSLMRVVMNTNVGRLNI